MSHLNLETLARLIDDAPDPTEAGHLDICAQCRAELEALRADAAALRELPDPEPPIAAWVTLEQRLQREGLVRRRAWLSNVMKLAAAIAIFIVGSASGALVVRQRTPVIARAPQAEPAGVLTATPQQIVPETIYQPAPTVLATSNPATAVSNLPARTPEEAMRRLQDAERTYVTALTRYQDFQRAPQVAGDPVARLAALESIVATTRAALVQAPADPVINGYHLTAVAQRDATLRQIAASKQQTQTWY